MTSIEFRGLIQDGVGRHKELIVPGRSRLQAAPADWPEKLHPGSLNVFISLQGFPPEFSARGIPMDIRKLDDGLFEPEFEIARDLLLNNLLAPRADAPRGGDAQVWRASLLLGNSMIDPPCWVLRRFGSRVGQQLELVAGVRLRDYPGILNGVEVKVRMKGRWATK